MVSKQRSGEGRCRRKDRRQDGAIIAGRVGQDWRGSKDDVGRLEGHLGQSDH